MEKIIGTFLIFPKKRELRFYYQIDQNIKYSGNCLKKWKIFLNENLFTDEKKSKLST